VKVKKLSEYKYVTPIAVRPRLLGVVGVILGVVGVVCVILGVVGVVGVVCVILGEVSLLGMHGYARLLLVELRQELSRLDVRRSLINVDELSYIFA
jgi:membrane-bound ClpP family serine protease